ncbi:MAG: DUF1003 domain-containing protein [Oscillospiraceae bacterium]|nr:DUF1003 domain-containing protein [Oscillospiraceae bacterium]
MNGPSKSELVNFILGSDYEDTREDEELIHMLLQKSIAANTNKTKKNLSFGTRLSDKLAQVAGSWAFIVLFCLALISWIVLNALFLTHPYDPYPFILLNLILSCIAAIQAPIIMMSQNRQDEKDRMRAENDYKVNLKSEIIVEDLHEKLDQILRTQERILAMAKMRESRKGSPAENETQKKD